MKINRKLSLSALLLTTLFSLGYIFNKPVINQDQAYHLFIDNRSWFGIPNFCDVVSNIFFFIFGAMGFAVVLKDKLLHTKKSWIIFFMGVVLVAPGSAYYHWNPNDATLVWDRLPMTIGFMALYTALLAEHIHLKFEKLLIPCCLLGLSSVIWWATSADLRFYYWIQLIPMVTIPILLALFPSIYTGRIWFLAVFILYALAKIVEHRDPEIFNLTQQMMSGHTLKHILASLAIFCLWQMMTTRKLKT